MASIEEKVDKLISRHEYRRALELIDTVPKPSVRLRQLEGLARRRLGQLDEAQRVLGALYEEDHRDPETMACTPRASWTDLIGEAM